MTVSRRAFLGSLGVGAAALAFGRVSLPADATTQAAAALDQVLRVGDTFTIAGRYAVNPITRTVTEHLQEFVVTAIDGPMISTRATSGGSAHYGMMDRMK